MLTADMGDELTAPTQLEMRWDQSALASKLRTRFTQFRVAGPSAAGKFGPAPCLTGPTKRERVQVPVPSECAVSSVGEHHIDTVGVASSILAPRTIQKARGYGLFLSMRGTRKGGREARFRPRKRLIFQAVRGTTRGTDFGLAAAPLSCPIGRATVRDPCRRLVSL